MEFGSQMNSHKYEMIFLLDPNNVEVLSIDEDFFYKTGNKKV